MTDVPPLVADERTMLVGWLELHRRTLLAKCRDLEPEQLALRSVPPSELSLLGLVRHMTEVEEHWFRRIFADERPPARYCTRDDRDGDFHGAAADNAAEGLDAFGIECQRSRELLDQVDSLDRLSRRSLGDQPVSMRWIVVHMIEEYARHNGHADLLRECVDGLVG
ncbi:MAG TPA: DinB family protein [Acidimicrobiales bacterium]|jgi:uncharacterized damage-inducible protein DinB|nr:DinB family protein [Acidimicrobiales bacterium]